MATFLARTLGSYRGFTGWMVVVLGLTLAWSAPGRFSLILGILGAAALGDRMAVRLWPGPDSRLSIARWLGLSAPEVSGG